MNGIDHKRLVQLEHQGRILVGVNRVYARKLYTDMPASAIKNATGETPCLEKLVVWFAFLASPLALLVSTLLAVISFGWWAFLIVPIAVSCWISNRSLSVRGDSSMWFITVALSAAVGAHFTNLLPSQWISGTLVVFAFAMWCDRLLYCASTVFLRAFVLRNPRALEACRDGITFRDVG